MVVLWSNAPRRSYQSLLDIPCTIHSILVTRRTIATMKFNNVMPSTEDANTIVDIATANMPTHIDNDLEPFDTCLDDAPSIILAIPANNSGHT